MRITVLTGIVCAAIWILIKMIFFYTQPVGYNITPLILINLFLLLASIAIGLYLQKMRDTEDGNGLRDIKNAMTAGVPYGLIVSVFLYFYYSAIDPEYNAHQIAEAEYMIQQELDKPGNIEKLKKQNPDFEVLSRDEIEKKLMDGHRSSTSPNAVFTLSMLGMIVMAALNSIFVTIIYRRIVFRPRGSS